MAVAVKNSPVSALERPLNPFAVGSWLGLTCILAIIAIVFYALDWAARAVEPTLTDNGLTPAVQTALVTVVRLCLLAGLGFLGYQLVGEHPPRGLSAGMAFAFAAVVVIGLVTCALGRASENWLGARSMSAIALTAVVGGGLLVGMAYSFFLPRFEQRLVQVQEQGWFTFAPYKRTQGQKVRRGTILGLLVLAGCGIWTVVSHKVLPAREWNVDLPFTEGQLPLLPNVRYTVPLLLSFASFWFAYRVVNYPVFADFLIATEAEVNKVSWTTRKRLIQDTIVVLITVVLLTVFLFVVDQIWAWLLTKIGVIQIGPPSGGEGGADVPY